MAREKVRHPKTEYAAQYPYVIHYQSQGGSTVAIDDTPGNERIRISIGRGGIYQEWDHTGRHVGMVAGDKHDYVKGGETKTADKNTDTFMNGHKRTGVGGDHHEEVAGGATTVNDDHIHVSKNNHTVLSTDGHNEGVTTGDKVSQHDGNIHTQTNGDVTDYVVGTRIQSTQGEAYEDVQDGNKSTVVDGDYKIKCKNFTLEADTVTITTLVGDITVTSAGKVIVNGQQEIDITTTGEFIYLHGKKYVKTLGEDEGTKIQGGGAGMPPSTFL